MVHVCRPPPPPRPTLMLELTRTLWPGLSWGLPARESQGRSGWHLDPRALLSVPLPLISVLGADFMVNSHTAAVRHLQAHSGPLAFPQLGPLVAAEPLPRTAQAEGSGLGQVKGPAPGPRASRTCQCRSVKAQAPRLLQDGPHRAFPAPGAPKGPPRPPLTAWPFIFLSALPAAPPRG